MMPLHTPERLSIAMRKSLQCYSPGYHTRSSRLNNLYIRFTYTAFLSHTALTSSTSHSFPQRRRTPINQSLAQIPQENKHQNNSSPASPVWPKLASLSSLQSLRKRIPFPPPAFPPKDRLNTYMKTQSETALRRKVSPQVGWVRVGLLCM